MDDQLCKHVAGHIGGPPGKGGLRTVPKSFMERFFINGGRISGGQLLCCAIAVLGKEKSQDVEEIKQLYEIVIRELERFVADEDRRSTVAKLFSLKEIDIEMCVERVRVLQLSLKSIRQGHGGLANECYLGASLDFAALFSSKEFAARSFLIFEHPDYVAEPPPTEVTEKLVGRYCAKKMNDPNSLDGTWVLGRITKVNSTDVHKADGRNGEGKQHKKLRFTWKDRANRTELIKVRLRLRDYDINWVLFETKKKKKKKQKKKEQHPPQKSRAKGPKAAKTAK
jgi:hypothetical protein